MREETLLKLKEFAGSEEDFERVVLLAKQAGYTDEKIDQIITTAKMWIPRLSDIDASVVRVLFLATIMSEIRVSTKEEVQDDLKQILSDFKTQIGSHLHELVDSTLEVHDQSQAGLRKEIGTTLELQQKTIDETKALLAQLGSEHQLAKNWIESILKGAKQELINPVINEVSKTASPFLQSIADSVARIEGAADSVSHKFALTIQAALQKSIDDTAAAIAEQNKRAYEGQLNAINKATNRIQALLQQAKEVKRKAEWFAFFKTTGTSLALVVTVQIVTLAIFAWVIQR